jgi:hypothetical protein
MEDMFDSAFGFDVGPDVDGVTPEYRFPVAGCTHKAVDANVSRISAYRWVPAEGHDVVRSTHS